MIGILPHGRTRAQIPQQRRAIAARRDEVARVCREDRVPHPLLVLLQRLRQLPRRRVEDARGPVAARRHEGSAVRGYLRVEEVRPEGVGAKRRGRSARLARAVALPQRPHEHLGVIVRGDERPGVVGHVHGLDGDAVVGRRRRGERIGNDVADALGAA